MTALRFVGVLVLTLLSVVNTAENSRERKALVMSTLLDLVKIMDERSIEMDLKIDDMIARSNIAFDALPEVMLERKGLCDFKYNGYCFWGINHREADVDFPIARTMCERQGGEVAVIYDEVHYNMTLEYARSTIPYTNTYSEMWLGMMIDTDTQHVSAHDRAIVPYMAWYPRNPEAPRRYRRISLFVRTDRNSREQGMINYPPTLNMNGVICQI